MYSLTLISIITVQKSFIQLQKSQSLTMILQLQEMWQMGFTVTNTNTEKVAVDVTKNWVGPATDSVTIKLLADGVEVESAVLTAT